MYSITYKGIQCIAWKEGPGYSLMTINLHNGCVADCGQTLGDVKEKVKQIVAQRLSGSSLLEET